MQGDSSLEAERWRKLLVWLERHGMDVSRNKFRVERRPRPGAGFGLFLTGHCPASQPLFIIPPTALINVHTLTAHYPNSDTLTAIQLISLHLFLSRAEGEEDSNDPLYGPFVSILPREFDSHPLTWVVKNTIKKRTPESVLLDLLPSAVVSSLTVLKDRLWGDWNAVSKYMGHTSSLKKFTKSEPVTDFLWAWLNVNTRSIYHRLKPTRSDPANLTLCPILDFANHSWRASHMIPVSNAEIRNTAPSTRRGDDFSFLASGNVAMNLGDEICLTYGTHSNRTLFTEYGFVNIVSQECIRSGEYPGEVDVQQVIEELFHSKGTVGSWMKEVLQNEGYWGDWTLHSSPASPSFRVTSALRLYAMFSESLTVPEPVNDALRPWRNTLFGITVQISGENERVWRSTLQQICQRLIEEGRLGKAKAAGAKLGSSNNDWVEWVRFNIEILWEEQVIVSDAVLKSIQDGIEF